MRYQEAWTFLDSLQLHKIKLGLESMQHFLAAVGSPEQGLRCIHVAGTNGKGSVSATLAAILSLAGLRVGLYTSPHLSSVRERFRINGELIPEHDFAAIMTLIRGAMNGGPITYFECTTALALLWFARAGVDVAVMEVGMGGRLDATNVIRPALGVITNVSMDHEAYLGNTLAAVAGEKAGIVKAGVPLVSGVAADVSREVVVRACKAASAPLYLLGKDFSGALNGDGAWGYRGLAMELEGLRCRLPGRHQVANAALALAALEILSGSGMRVEEEAIRRGLREVQWPGRLERFDLAGRAPGEAHRFLLDGAHNPAAVQALKDALAEEAADRDRLILVWSSMADKDFRTGLSLLAPLCQRIILTRPRSERAVSPETLRAALPAEFRSKAGCADSTREALAAAVAGAGPRDLICVSGSLYLVGEARDILTEDGSVAV